MNEYGKRVAKKMEDYMGDPNSVGKEINDIQNAIEGVEVRGALAAGVAKSFNKSKWAEEKAIEQTERVDTLIKENPQPSEVVDARGNYPILRDRLDSVDSRLAQTKDEVEELRQITATKEELYQESNAKANKSYVDNKVSEVERRIDEIIITPAEGISEQEIIDAREHKSTLGANIREIREKASVGLENKVIDGNFTKGLEEHTILRQRVDFVDGNVILTGESSPITTGIIGQKLADHIPTDENWYFISRIRALDEFEWIGVGARGTSSGISVSRVYYPTPMKWYTISHYMSGNDYNDFSGDFSAATWGGDPEAIGKRVEVEYYMAFNLTEAFGRGNEPTKEEIDKLLLDAGYFEGDLGSGRMAKRLFDSQLGLEKEITKIRHSHLENILKYGKDFWRGWTGTLTSYDESNDTVTVRGTGTASIVGSLQDIEGRYEKGHKLFVSADITPKTNMRHLGFALVTHLAGDENITYLTTSNFEVGKKVNVSGVIEVPATTEALRLQLRTRFDTPEETDGAETVFENIFLYDLTSFFGKGNEPNTEAFRRMLNVIDVKKGYTELAETQKALTQFVLDRVNSIKVGIERKPLCLLEFDDGNMTDYTHALPFLRARGIRATSNIAISLLNNPNYMGWDELHELKNVGWDIEGHTYNNVTLPSLTDEEIRQEMEMSNQAFLNNGFGYIRHETLVGGVGYGDERIKRIVSEYRKTLRNISGYTQRRYNTYDDIDWYNLWAMPIDMREDRADRVPVMKQMALEARQNNGILILVTHRFVESNAGPGEGYFEPWAEFIDYLIDLDFEFVTRNELYLRLR